MAPPRICIAVFGDLDRPGAQGRRHASSSLLAAGRCELHYGPAAAHAL